VGLKTSHAVEQLNDILINRCDPLISLEYAEKSICGHQVGIIEIHGANPPYIISVQDKFGGKRTSGKPCYISRGMLYIRNNNKNEGAVRENVDRMYESKVKYVVLQADLQLTYEVSVKPLDNSKEVDIKFFLRNLGDVIATDTYMFLVFKNVKRIVKCKDPWADLSASNESRPTARLLQDMPVIKPVRLHCSGVVVEVDNNTQQIEAELTMGATNMRIREDTYIIFLPDK
jgi:hypothetical protein